MTSVDKKISYRPVYNATTEHLEGTEFYLYEILTRSNDFTQFRDLMMELLANRPSVTQLNDIKGTGKWNSQSFKSGSESYKEYVLEEEDRILDLESKEEAFYEKLDSIPYIENIETLTNSFPLHSKRPHVYLESGIEKKLYPFEHGVFALPEKPNLFEGLQIHKDFSEGGKNKKTRKNRKPRK